MLTPTRFLRLMILGPLLLAMLAGLNGCKKQPFLKTVEQTPYLGMPANLEQLDSIDLGRLRSRDGFMALIKGLERKLQLTTPLENMRERTGFDLWQQVEVLSVGSRGSSPANPFQKMVFIARGDFKDPGPTLAKLHDWLAEEYLIAPPPFKESTHQATSIKIFQTAGQSQFNEALVFKLNFGFPSDKLMVFSFSPELFDETLSVIGGAAEGIQKDQQWQAMLQRPDVGATLWGTGNITNGAAGQAASVMPALEPLRGAKQYYYDLNWSQNVLLQIGLVSDSIEAATKLTDALKGVQEQMKAIAATLAAKAPQTAQLPGKFVLTTELQTSKLTLKLSEDERRLLSSEWEDLVEKAQRTPLPTPAGSPTPEVPALRAPGATPPPAQ